LDDRLIVLLPLIQRGADGIDSGRWHLYQLIESAGVGYSIGAASSRLIGSPLLPWVRPTADVSAEAVAVGNLYLSLRLFSISKSETPPADVHGDLVFRGSVPVAQVFVDHTHGRDSHAVLYDVQAAGGSIIGAFG
jgi:hypothetical protein